MGNYLKMADRQRILALLELGWSYRRIERETGVRRETVARYDPGKDSKADNPSTGSAAKPAIRRPRWTSSRDHQPSMGRVVGGGVPGSFG
jgi:hypothetical protein